MGTTKKKSMDINNSEQNTQEIEEDQLECLINMCTDKQLHMMPCCGKPEGTLRVCMECITTLAHFCDDLGANIGRCPVCKKSYKIEDGQIKKNVQYGECKLCRGGHYKELVEGGKCEACIMGQKLSLTYECHKCLKTQRIPHPMFWYTKTYKGYSGANWACHQGCGTYTHWRVVDKDVDNVPYLRWPTANWGVKYSGEKASFQG